MSALEVFKLPVLLVRHRELLWSFVWRELKARYEGSLLGRLWPLLNPIILFLVYYFVFAVIMRMRLEIKGVETDDPSLFGLYLIAGLLPWLFLNETAVKCTGVVLENGNLVKKIAFPSQLLPIYTVVSNGIYFLIGLVVFLIVRVTWLGDAGGLPMLPDSWPFLFIAILLQLVFVTGIGLFLGALNIFIRDTSQVIALIMQLWFFTTPIVYPVSLIEENLPDYAFLMKANPVYHLMEIYRAALVADAGVYPWQPTWMFAIMALVVFVPGYAFFLATKGRFADEL